MNSCTNELYCKTRFYRKIFISSQFYHSFCPLLYLFIACLDTFGYKQEFSSLFIHNLCFFCIYWCPCRNISGDLYASKFTLHVYWIFNSMQSNLITIRLPREQKSIFYEILSIVIPFLRQFKICPTFEQRKLIPYL